MISLGDASSLNLAVYNEPGASLPEGWEEQDFVVDREAGLTMGHYSNGHATTWQYGAAGVLPTSCRPCGCFLEPTPWSVSRLPGIKLKADLGKTPTLPPWPWEAIPWVAWLQRPWPRSSACPAWPRTPQGG